MINNRCFVKFSNGLPCMTELTTIYNNLILFYANLNSLKHKLDPCDANLNSQERKLDSFDANLNSQKRKLDSLCVEILKRKQFAWRGGNRSPHVMVALELS